MKPAEIDALLASAEAGRSSMGEVHAALKGVDLPVAVGSDGRPEALVLDGVPHVVPTPRPSSSRSADGRRRRTRPPPRASSPRRCRRPWVWHSTRAAAASP